MKTSNMILARVEEMQNVLDELHDNAEVWNKLSESNFESYTQMFYKVIDNITLLQQILSGTNNICAFTEKAIINKTILLTAEASEESNKIFRQAKQS